MSKSLEKAFLIILDFIAITSAFFLWGALRKSMGFLSQSLAIDAFGISFVVYIYWVLLFLFFGHYKTWFTRSRIDEFFSAMKTISIGVFLIFLMTFDLERDTSGPPSLSRIMIISYWIIMVFCVGTGRVILRTVHRSLLEHGIGRRRSIIIGWGKKARELYDMVIGAPALGYEVVGFLYHGSAPGNKGYKDVPIKGALNDLNRIILEDSIQEVLIAVPRRSEKHLEEVIRQCDGTPVGIKIVPDLYDVIIGQVRTNQIYGFPLIEILPQLMAPWEQLVKRLGDILFSLFVLVGFLPFWLIIALAIKIDSRGPVFYTQKRVGKGGKNYKIAKFRSMVTDAEKISGPVWAIKADSRITRIGKILRKLRLDEIPQLINVLDGHMSLVGPRPERPFFVEKLKKMFPLYARRLRVRPGITGWAQVKGEYDQSLEHVKQKLEYDLFYMENMSLKMDLKILFNTVYVMIRGKGH